jgi:hypothetical protein
MRFLCGTFLAAAVMSQLSSAALDLALKPATGGTFRFKDIGGQAFSSSFAAAFNYANSSVLVTIDDRTDLFLSGRIKATGLKPNFAYQIKLSTRSSKAATNDEERAQLDDVTNERLGRLGRWWRFAPNPANALDADFDRDKDLDGYIYGGYLIIGFFVTDPDGNADLAFSGNNSFHVLWRTDQRQPSINDGPPQTVTIPETTGNAAYDTFVAARNIGLYGEHEPTRALPGKLAMPLGNYRCEINLTEESFHDGGANAGNWATAMYAPLQFSIPTANFTASTNPLTIDSVRANMKSGSGGRDFATLSGTLTLPTDLEFSGQEVTLNLLGVTRTVVLSRMGSGTAKDATLLLRRDRDNPASVRFSVRVRRAAFVLGILNSAGPMPFTVDLTATIGGQVYSGKATTQLRVRGSHIDVKN